MKISAEKDNQAQYIVTIEFDMAEMASARTKATKKLAGRYRIPGFRPGKAPAFLIEQYVGREAIAQEAAQDLFPNAYKQALDEHSISPIAEPELEIKTNDPLVIVATVPVEPTVKLGDYSNIYVPVEPEAVADTDVDKVIEDLREQQSTWEEPESERAAQEGDQVEFELVVVRDGQVSGGEPTTRTGVLGKGDLLSDLDEGVRGLSVGETKTIEIRPKRPTPTETTDSETASDEATDSETETPVAAAESDSAPTAEIDDTPTAEAAPDATAQSDDAPAEIEAATPADDKPLLTYQVRMVSIKEKHQPELNDEFAASVSDLSSLETLRERIHANLVRNADQRAKNAAIDAISEQIAQQAEIEYAPIMVDAQIHELEERFTEQLKEQKVTIDQYLRFSNQTHEQFHDELRPRAIERLRISLAMREFARAEGIEIGDTEIDAEIERVVNEFMDQMRAADVAAPTDTDTDAEMSLAEGDSDPDDTTAAELALAGDDQDTTAAELALAGDDADVAPAESAEDREARLAESANRLRDLYSQKQSRDNIAENLFSQRLADKLLEVGTKGSPANAERTVTATTAEATSDIAPQEATNSDTTPTQSAE